MDSMGILVIGIIVVASVAWQIFIFFSSRFIFCSFSTDYCVSFSFWIDAAIDWNTVLI